MALPLLRSQSATYSVPLVASYTYAWIVDGGTGSSSTNSIDVNWGAGPIGTVNVVVNNTNASNCSNNFSQAVTINTNTTLGPDMSDAEDAFALYPNPAQDRTVLYYPRFSGMTRPMVQVVDLLGNELRSFVLQQDRGSIDLSDLKHGIYFVRVSTDHGSFAKKLIVQ
ncbi:MAG: T9SS type A sorting domain-containing protein [Flavobacteriales bacterium]